LRGGDPQRHFAWCEIFPRRGEIGAEIEHFVLNREQRLALAGVGHVEQGDAYRAVGFVDIADGDGARMRL
jgi:hypothetical protein